MIKPSAKKVLLEMFINNYPPKGEYLIPSHTIHTAVPFCDSCDVRFRELRNRYGLNIQYRAEKKSYQVHTKKAELKKILKLIAV